MANSQANQTAQESALQKPSTATENLTVWTRNDNLNTPQVASIQQVLVTQAPSTSQHQDSTKSGLWDEVCTPLAASEQLIF
jgi:hypothetical protein